MALEGPYRWGKQAEADRVAAIDAVDQGREFLGRSVHAPYGERHLRCRTSGAWGKASADVEFRPSDERNPLRKFQPE